MAVAETVVPVAETTFGFKLHAPTTLGSFNACFGLVSGKHWFSDPGQNGPADDVVCRKVDVVTSAEIGKDLGDEPEGAAALEGSSGGCGCHTAGGQPASMLTVLGALAGGLGLARRRRRWQ